MNRTRAPEGPVRHGLAFLSPVCQAPAGLRPFSVLYAAGFVTNELVSGCQLSLVVKCRIGRHVVQVLLYDRFFVDVTRINKPVVFLR